MSFTIRWCAVKLASNTGKMDTINGMDAVRKAEMVSRAGGTFNLAFYPYSRERTRLSGRLELKLMTGCSCRKPLPHDKFEIEGKHYFLFTDDGCNPKMCYRNLIRYIGFPDNNYRLTKVIWYE